MLRHHTIYTVQLTDDKSQKCSAKSNFYFILIFTQMGVTVAVNILGKSALDRAHIC